MRQDVPSFETERRDVSFPYSPPILPLDNGTENNYLHYQKNRI